MKRTKPFRTFSTKKTSDLIGEIATSIQEQAEGMAKSTEAMQKIDSIAQQNAATSEETAATSEELNAQANMLLQNVIEVARIVGVEVDQSNSKHRLPPAAGNS